MIPNATTNAKSDSHLIGVLALMMTLTNFGCESKVEVEKINAVKTSASATKLKPITAMPGDVVTITGSDFKSNRQKNFVKITNSRGDEVTAPATVTSDTEATFVMPEGVGLGLTAVVLESNGKQLTGSMPFVVNLAGNGLPIIIDDAAEICSTKQYIDRNGDTQTGTKNCSGGGGGSTPACSADGGSNCVVDGTTYKAAAVANLSAGNIKSGVTIAGQLGDYPSASNPLSGATGTVDLEQGNFDAQIKSATAFEYWTSAGSRQTGNGDADITASNIKDSVSIFGTSGTFTGTAPNAWDLRVGVTAGGVTGKLKVNCRNQANPTLFDIDQGQAATITTGSPGTLNITAHGLANTTTVRINYSSVPLGLGNGTTYYVVNATANTLQLSTTSGGAAINITSAGTDVTVHKWQATPQTVDIWDTIDDYNNNTAGMPGTVVSGWTNNDCGGVEATAGDDKVWKDVTTTAGGAASNCTTDGGRCTMQDKISGLWWSKQQTSANWWQAISSCQSLNHNGQTGWRLPTQKELMDAYNHGVRSAASTNWITEANMPNYYWSASSQSNNSAVQAWHVSLARSYTALLDKYDASQIVCVR
jgi:hypothetical protein